MSIINNVLNWFHNLFSKADSLLKAEVPVAINAVQILKSFLNSPAADILAALTGTTALEQSLKTIVPQVLIELQLLEGVNTSSTDAEINAAIQTFVASIPGMSAQKQQILYSTIAGLVLKELNASGQLTFGEAVSLVEMYYQTTVKVAKPQ